MRATYLGCTSQHFPWSLQANPQTAAQITAHSYTLYPGDYKVIAEVFLNKKINWRFRLHTG
jgi:hypothetical protein